MATANLIRGERFTSIVYQKALPFQAVRMDTWYATQDWRGFIEWLPKDDACPRQDNRQVDNSGGQHRNQRVDLR